MKQKVTKTVCNEHYLYPLNYTLPMPVNILEQYFIIFPMLFQYHNEVCESPDTMALFEPSPKTLYKIQPKNSQSGIMTNFVFKCDKNRSEPLIDWLQLPPGESSCRKTLLYTLRKM